MFKNWELHRKVSKSHKGPLCVLPLFTKQKLFSWWQLYLSNYAIVLVKVKQYPIRASTFSTVTFYCLYVLILYVYLFFCLSTFSKPVFFFILTGENVKMPKNMISNRERHAKHWLAVQNTHQLFCAKDIWSSKK